MSLPIEAIRALNEAVEAWLSAGQPTCSEEAIFAAGMAFQRAADVKIIRNAELVSPLPDGRYVLRLVADILERPPT